MLSDYTGLEGTGPTTSHDSPHKPHSSPGHATGHNYNPPPTTQFHIQDEGATADASTVKQQQSARPKHTNMFLSSPSPQQQHHTQYSGQGWQLTPPPPTLSPHTPANVSTLPRHQIGRSGYRLPTPAQVQAAHPSPLTYTSNSDSTHAPQLPMPNSRNPQMNLSNNPPVQHHSQSLAHNEMTPRRPPATGERGPIPMNVNYGNVDYATPSHASATAHLQTPAAHPQASLYPHALPQAIHDTASPHTPAPVYFQMPTPDPQARMYPTILTQNLDHAAPLHGPAPVHPWTPASDPRVNVYPNALPQSTPLPPFFAPNSAIAQPSPPAAYGGFLQTHQVKNVQIFTGHSDSKMLVEDWIRDMQYLLEAIELPMHLRFSTVVRHLGGEARRLVLNLPPHDQTPEKAFEELRAEYSDTYGSLDPLADFYERIQRPGESCCSYAIALEATLRAVEDSERGGRPFPDRDSKLTRQFLRGLEDEETYARILPMKPRLLSFRELQQELRDLAKETKKFQPQHKTKKAYAQVHGTPECGTNEKTETSKQNSELSELREIVQKLALSQEQQMAMLSHLESRILVPPTVQPAGSPTVPPAVSRIVPPAAPPQRFQSSPRTTVQGSSVTCYRCGKLGHIARVCRAALPDPSLSLAQQPQPVTPVEGNTAPSAQHLNA
ncbi:uncharacterized protein LOC133562081 [Nerophis ophidion]|uniref:uncharacterized protein LOC133562081 n=1 Tax=Nerophis ophidion TaxID=159077 RepID=UPI002ADF852E|nr:uncharacterized protein LOC133562081 [Nerophis ophidion]